MLKEKKMKHEYHTTPSDSETSTLDRVRWAKELFDLHARIAPYFARVEPLRRTLAYLQGWLQRNPAQKWLAIGSNRAREETPYGMQRLLS
jgi:hypothetical protein